MASTVQSAHAFDHNVFSSAFYRPSNFRTYENETVFSTAAFGSSIWQSTVRDESRTTKGGASNSAGSQATRNLSIIPPIRKNSGHQYANFSDKKSPIILDGASASQTEPSSANSRSNNDSAILTPNSLSSVSEHFAQTSSTIPATRTAPKIINIPQSYQDSATAWTAAKEFRPTTRSNIQRQNDASERSTIRHFTNTAFQQNSSQNQGLESIWSQAAPTQSFESHNQHIHKPALPLRASSYNSGYNPQARMLESSTCDLEQPMQSLQLGQLHSNSRGVKHSQSGYSKSVAPPYHVNYSYDQQSSTSTWPTGVSGHRQIKPHDNESIDQSAASRSLYKDGFYAQQHLSVRAPSSYAAQATDRQHSLNSYLQQPLAEDYYSRNDGLPMHIRNGGYGFNAHPDAPYMMLEGSLDHPAEANHIYRSPLLEEFRVNKSRKFELKDIQDHIVEFSGDQLGSRFIQQKLEVANSDEKDRVFNEIAQDSRQLMTDVFGNYVIQKMFEHGNQSQKKLLASHMRGHVFALSTQTYGCRVVQKALEHILTDQQASFIKELDGCVLKVVENQNGNHVIQKAIERIPGEHIQFIVDAHRGHVHYLAKHAYGCRVIQRMLEHCTPRAKRQILDELHINISDLIQDPFGNYVVQHVIANGEQQDRKPVIDVVVSRLLENATHKFASNVVEKALDYADEEQRRNMLRRLTQRDESGNSQILKLLSHQYGNYVIQKSASHLHGHALASQIQEMEQYLLQLRRVSTGKQVTALEKSIHEARQRLDCQRYDAGLANAPLQPRIGLARR